MDFNSFFKIVAGILFILECNSYAMDQVSQATIYDAGPVRGKQMTLKTAPDTRTHYLTPSQHTALINASPTDREKFMDLTNEEQKNLPSGIQTEQALSGTSTVTAEPKGPVINSTGVDPLWKKISTSNPGYSPEVKDQLQATSLAPLVPAVNPGGNIIQDKFSLYQDQKNERQEVSELQKQMSDLQAEGKVDEADETKRALNTAKQKLQYKGNEFTRYQNDRALGAHRPPIE